ncbi:FtsW/RodA/SpoVE family cell cycle protein [Adlercreutzia murintestinalis]|uniref:FtsW/RodA/SpoVE family cell cycle protein n=1 Tax=Adlercreutzia murintestinalis TaxID=2941325 RepID=UPI00204027B0|nr:FtsW/RodA/SpoVE family cell cycle protein [Adlercreutzia murintestinalis]
MTRRNMELLLLIVAAPIVIVLFAMLVVTGGQTLSFNTLGVPIGIFVVFLIAHFAVRKLTPNADPALLPITFALSGIGIAFVTRLVPDLAMRQLMWMFAGVAAMIIVLVVVRNLDKLANYKYTFMIVGVLLLLSPMLPVVGIEINGSRLWLSVGGFSFQPGELAKICIVVFLAGYLAQNREMLSVFTWKVGPVRLPSLSTLVPLLAMWALAFLIVVLEKDLGSALVLFAVFLVMLYVATGKVQYVVVGLLLAAVAAVALFFMFDHVRVRVDVWLDPFADAQNKGYQIVQSLYSLADGGMFGVGIGRGMADIIPYAESDFIFSAIGEECGLLGAAGVLLLYLCFAIRGMLTAARAKSDVSSFAAVGATSIVILQAFIIVGGVTRLIPLTGITLPFISQGGSSLLAGFIIVALLLRAGDAGTGSDVEMTSAITRSRHSSNSVLGRVALGKNITFALIFFSVLFAALVANLTYIMVINAEAYQNMPGNSHTMAKEAQSERGTISTYDGVVLAQSVEQPDGTYERVYPAGTLAAHVVGYYSGTYGTAGIEAECNDTLKGSENYASWTDVMNSLAGIAQPGNDVTLTLNSKIQQAAQDALAGERGACVVMDPQTGAVFALASSPTYDAADVENVIANSSEGSSELLNRATQALYAPGSTFKMVTLAGALEDGVCTDDSQYDAPGEMDIGNAPVTNMHERSYGTVTVRRAFELSANTVFAQMGVELGSERLVAAAKAFGFNAPVEFDLPLATSLMPDPQEMTTWETAWAAAGEPVGEHESPAGPQATVLEMAMVGSAMANGGQIMQPYLVEGIYNASGARSYTASPTPLMRATTQQVADDVLAAMKGVVANGTGAAAAVPGVTVAGKTGTAEHEGKENDSWFVGVADADGACNLVVALMIEEAGSRTSAAAQAQSVIRTALEVQGTL